MAVVTVKSTIIANRDASPTVLTEPAVSGGVLKQAMGYATVTSGDSIASKYILTQVPSNARITSVDLGCDAITSAAANIGVYYPTNNPGNPSLNGTAVSAALFASALSIATAISPPTNQINQSTSNAIANQELPLWQAAGLSADPECMLDIALALTAAATATGKVQLKVGYVL